MNHQTVRIIEAAKDVVSDEGVFSEDQINTLKLMIDGIAAAIEKEVDCNKSNAPCF